MNIRKYTCCGAIVCGLVLQAAPMMAQGPVGTSQITARPEVERIDFEGLDAVQQQMIMSRISLRIGSVLSADARQRVATELRTLGKDMGKTLTFTYKPGSKSSTVLFKISDGC